MKKIFKIIGIVLLSALVLNISVFIIARHGWRLFGFDMCENPDMLYMDNVYVTDSYIHIRGNTMSSASSFVGYTYKIKDNALLVGIKQNMLLGFGSRRGAYSFRIEDDFSGIEKIILKGNYSEGKCIWSIEEDKKWMEKIDAVRLYKSVFVEKGMDCALRAENADFVYADDELLDRIRHSEFRNDIYLSKGGSYLGVAELFNGEEIYLEFEMNYDDYFVIGNVGNYSY